MDLSIIIVNWNSKDYLRRCIDSIFANTHDIEFEIIVIDNASFDGCEAMLRIHYPQVRFIQGMENRGFARANNAAFVRSAGRNLLFLNPDTEITDNAVAKLHGSLRSLPSAAVVGPRLLNDDRSIQASCIQAFPTLTNQVFDSNALRALFPTADLWGTKPLFGNSEGPSEVDAVSGASLMITRSAFERVGMFTEDFFMYSEDIDLCFKIAEQGLKTYYVPSAVVVHYGGASASQNRIDSFSNVMLLESRWRFFRRTRPAWYCWAYRMAMFSASIVRIGIALSLWPARRLQGDGSSVRTVLRKWTSRMRWAVGGEVWVRNY